MQRYAIKPYFIAAGKALTYDDQRRQMLCSLEDKPFPVFPEELQEHTFFEFGSIEEHFKYRDAVMKAYPHGHFPVFQNFNHMQYQIKDPKGFAEMLDTCKRSHATVTMGAAHPTCIPCSKAVKKAQASAKGRLRPFAEPRGGS